MSTLQCPATLLLAPPGAQVPAAGRRIAQVLTKDDVQGLSSADPATLRETLAEIADQTPGETTLVLALDDGLRSALPHLARLEVAPDALATAQTLELVIDADAWVLRVPD
jgi:hypothetical protein